MYIKKYPLVFACTRKHCSTLQLFCVDRFQNKIVIIIGFWTFVVVYTFVFIYSRQVYYRTPDECLMVLTAV